MHGLWVVTTVSNPVRFRSRYELYRKFEQHMKESGANLLTVEVAFGERPFGVTEQGNPHHVQLRTSSEVWHKETSLNLGVARLPYDWKYLAWVDADVTFIRKDWVQETVEQLQHFAVVQMFDTAIDLGPNGETVQVFNGFGSSWFKGLPQFTTTGPPSSPYYPGDYYGAKGVATAGSATRKFWHPGYAWAIRREAFEGVGGLLDVGILGAGDHHMALSMIHQGDQAVPKGLHPNYMRAVMRWQDRCDRHVRRSLGYVPGTLFHAWHGKKKDRRYWDRWDILRRHGYNPEADVKRDYQGLWTLSDQGQRLRLDLQRYFRQRNEDSIDTD